MQNPTIHVIPAQLVLDLDRGAETQSHPNPDPSFAKIINPSNPINLVKILTVKNSENLCQKICISLAPQVVRPPRAENFSHSLFVRNIQKSTKIVKNQKSKVVKSGSKVVHFLSKVGQKWSTSCQNHTTF